MKLRVKPSLHRGAHSPILGEATRDSPGVVVVDLDLSIDKFDSKRGLESSVSCIIHSPLPCDLEHFELGNYEPTGALADHT